MTTAAGADATPLPDGTYDALVIDATAEVPGGTTVVELVLTSGPHKGEVVAVAGGASGGDPIDLLGLPATLTVEAGSPRVAIDR